MEGAVQGLAAQAEDHGTAWANDDQLAETMGAAPSSVNGNHHRLWHGAHSRKVVNTQKMTFGRLQTSRGGDVVSLIAVGSGVDTGRTGTAKRGFFLPIHNSFAFTRALESRFLDFWQVCW